MKPKAATEHEDGLLEYLEDIIGTSKYKDPIEEASVSVEKMNEERGEKLNRVKLVEGDLKALEVRRTLQSFSCVYSLKNKKPKDT
jgi:structural maintenance of chromosome 4